jgi:hypothetical protein
MNIAEYTLIDCATGLSHGPFELVDQARHRAEVGNIAKWKIINRDGELVAWTKASGSLIAKRRRQTPDKRSIAAEQALIRRCHRDPEFRKKMVAICRAQLAQNSAVKAERGEAA